VRREEKGGEEVKRHPSIVSNPYSVHSTLWFSTFGFRQHRASERGEEGGGGGEGGKKEVRILARMTKRCVAFPSTKGRRKKEKRSPRFSPSSSISNSDRSSSAKIAPSYACWAERKKKKKEEEIGARMRRQSIQKPSAFGGGKRKKKKGEGSPRNALFSLFTAPVIKKGVALTSDR